MMILPHLKSAWSDFKKNESGSASVELVFMVPLLAFITFAIVTYFAAFRAQTHATRAATVMTDMVSRERAAITPEYIAGLEGLMKTLVYTRDDYVDSDTGEVTSTTPPEFRLTVFSFDEENDTFDVSWSKANGTYVEMTPTAMNAVSDRLPNLGDGQAAILVETRVNYNPLLKMVGLGTQSFENFNVAIPRFVPQLCFMEDENADPTTAQC